jgi:uncharacterized SAM-binding protein YcdF (DUF218 family)
MIRASMEKNNKRIWRVLLFVGCLIFFITFIFTSAGNYLAIDEKPKKSDVIIVLSGGGIDRLEKGVVLYEKGFSDRLMISNSNEDKLYETALKMGVPSKSIILENHARSTTENAAFTINLMGKHKFRSAIVVSSNYHMRRVKNNYEKVNKKEWFTFIYCSSNYNSYNPKRWWKRKDNLTITMKEYVKIVGNHMGIHGDRAKVILENLLIRVFYR